MALSKELRKMVEEKLGRRIIYSTDRETLAAAIEESVGERLGTTTIKRMFGFTREDVTPRGATLDILARFLGYDDMRDMEIRHGDASDISNFSPVKHVDASQLAAGDMVRLEYRPDRGLLLRYDADGWFDVVESINGKLRIGDRVRLSMLALGFELLITSVVRDGIVLGQYHSAKDGGLTLLELL